MSNDGDREQTLRTSTGVALDYNGDWLAKFDANAVPGSDYNGRLLAFINSQLGTSYDEINGAKYAYATAQSIDGALSFNELGTSTIVGG
ncbi:hypothetical protein [Bradyrhizobium genomosp. III]|uniref:hypothetical protein n=1 Tax=Bradyrhizobium genomosp. III TaxID=2683271 RepID=UPI0004B15066|nr:hypothetical protein [Bradyrhizobium sp. CCBAU 15544]